jgi:hypothetical protein
MSGITMYGLTKIVNSQGEKALGSRWAHVREQHMYNYRKNGMIKAVGTDGRISQAAANDFAAAFVAKRVAKLATEQPTS